LYLPTYARTYILWPITIVAGLDPGSGAFLTPGSGMDKKSRSWSGMNITHHISESLETIFWVKIFKFFDADPDPGSGISMIGSEMEKIGIRDKHIWSATLPITYIVHKVYLYVKIKFSVTANSDQDPDPALICIVLAPWVWIRIRNETNTDP
jgi:hypothetical protein